jgi:hypothetical protein
MQEFEFVDNRRVLWFVGILVVLLGLLTVFVILPRAGRNPGMGGPDINLPKMGALPPPGAPRMPAQVNHDDEAHP